MAAAIGIGVSVGQRIWRAHRLQPHRVRTFKLSKDSPLTRELKDAIHDFIADADASPRPFF
jgi:hypothetical protein